MAEFPKDERVAFPKAERALTPKAVQAEFPKAEQACSPTDDLAEAEQVDTGRSKSEAVILQAFGKPRRSCRHR